MTLAALFAGLFSGIGLEIIFRAGGLKNIIKEIDERAFVTVFSVNEVIGEGFKMEV